MGTTISFDPSHLREVSSLTVPLARPPRMAPPRVATRTGVVQTLRHASLIVYPMLMGCNATLNPSVEDHVTTQIIACRASRLQDPTGRPCRTTSAPCPRWIHHPSGGESRDRPGKTLPEPHPSGSSTSTRPLHSSNPKLGSCTGSHRRCQT